jgi:hypothetical protein
MPPPPPYPSPPPAIIIIIIIITIITIITTITATATVSVRVVDSVLVVASPHASSASPAVSDAFVPGHGRGGERCH